MERSYKMKRAWLVTWEWCGDHAKKEEKVITIFNARITGEKVKEKIEKMYIESECIPSELVAFVQNSKNHPYPAKFDKINGVNWQGRIFCGHNPHIYARHVKNLQVKTSPEGNEYFAWEELPKPKINL